MIRCGQARHVASTAALAQEGKRNDVCKYCNYRWSDHIEHHMSRGQEEGSNPSRQVGRDYFPPPRQPRQASTPAPPGAPTGVEIVESVVNKPKEKP